MASYKNAMEQLVEEEVDRHLKSLPPRVASYINRLELIAYALNQLPSLYATSEKGLQYQIQRGKTRFKDQIFQAVQRAFAAIRRDPIRTYVPLQSQQQSAPLREVLHQMRLLLKNDKVEWENLPGAVEQAIKQKEKRGVTWDARYEPLPQSVEYIPQVKLPQGYSAFPTPKAYQYSPVEVNSAEPPATSNPVVPPPLSEDQSTGDVTAADWDNPLYKH